MVASTPMQLHLALVEATRTDAAPLTPAAPAAAPAVLPEPAEALPTNAVPDRPLDRSKIVARGPGGALVVAQKNGKGVDGIQLSQHNLEIGSPMIAVAPDGTIHAAFVEKHSTTYAYAVYYRSSSDGGKT